MLELEFDGAVFVGRGPAPFHFVVRVHLEVDDLPSEAR